MTEKLKLEVNEYLPLRDVVFRTLRQAIFQGQLKPGERLMEIHLARQLGVSRTPVREAIHMLEADGLAVMVPRKGAVVSEITVSDLEDVLEVRACLEDLAARKASQNITDEQLCCLKQAQERFASCLQQNDVIASAEADIAFHEIITQATQNRRLITILNNIREQIYRYRLENLKDHSSYSHLMTEHDAIVAALEAHDEEAASKAIQVHITNQKQSIVAFLHI